MLLKAITVASKKLDDVAYSFRLAMSARIGRHLMKGKEGWDDILVTPDKYLISAMKKNIEKGDWLDAAVYCMFLWWRQQ